MSASSMGSIVKESLGWSLGEHLLVNPMAGLASLTLALAIYLFGKGVLEFLLSARLRPMPGAGWLLFDGIISVILAVMIWRAWPSNKEWVIGTLVRISILFSGCCLWLRVVWWSSWLRSGTMNTERIFAFVGVRSKRTAWAP